MHTSPVTPALVARPSLRAIDPSQYLLMSPEGTAAWVGDPAAATAFESMREAMRAALRLPGSVRAFALPRGVELAAQLN
jgi:hypothetical protein